MYTNELHYKEISVGRCQQRRVNQKELWSRRKNRKGSGGNVGLAERE